MVRATCVNYEVDEVELDENRNETNEDLYSEEARLASWNDLMREYELEGCGAD